MLKKDVTFIAEFESDISLLTPLHEEALKRGYKSRITKNIFAKCEIGVYCQHVNFPKNSKFSVIMLHDALQQYSRWPNIWYREPWNEFDVGLLPGKVFIDNWLECSHHAYAHPKKGVFEAGWPKGDVLFKKDFPKIRESLLETYRIDPRKKTVIYAPSWECNNKQNDFVESMKNLDVNILIKHAAMSKNEYQDIKKNIAEMNALHQDMEDVFILDPRISIVNALSISDILVSDESSTLIEATLLGKPAIAVQDWLIPDTIPSRFPVQFNFTIKAQKNTLKTVVQDTIENYDKYCQVADNYRDSYFSNIGTTSSRIMDIVEDAIGFNKIKISSIKPLNTTIMENEKDRRTRLRKYRKRKESKIIEKRPYFKIYFSILNYMIRLRKFFQKVVLFK